MKKLFSRTFKSVVFEVLARFGEAGTISVALCPGVAALCAKYGLKNRKGKAYNCIGFEELYHSIRRALYGLKLERSVDFIPSKDEYIPPEPGKRAGLYKVH